MTYDRARFDDILAAMEAEFGPIDGSPTCGPQWLSPLERDALASAVALRDRAEAEHVALQRRRAWTELGGGALVLAAALVAVIRWRR